MEPRVEAKLTNFQGWRTVLLRRELNRMIEAALVEPDQEKQEALYEQIQRRYEEVVPAIQPISEVIEPSPSARRSRSW